MPAADRSTSPTRSPVRASSTSCWSRGSCRISTTTGSCRRRRTCIERLGLVRARDPLRQARHRPLRPHGRAARLRDADGRRARGDGRGRQRAGRTVRLLGGRAAGDAVRRDLPGAGARARRCTAPTPSAPGPTTTTRGARRPSSGRRTRRRSSASGASRPISRRMAPSADDAFKRWWMTRARRLASPGSARDLVADELAGRRARRAAARSRRRRSCCTAATTSTRGSRRAATSPRTSPARGSSSSRETPTCRCGSRTTCSTRSRSSSPACGRRTSTTACSRRSSSPTSSARPSAPGELGDRAWARAARRATTRSCGTSSSGSAARRSTPRATASWRCSTARRARSAARLAIRDGLAELGLEVRAGVHTGEVERPRGEKPRGIAVHIGARVAAAGRARARCSCLGHDPRPGRGLGARVSRPRASSS